MADEIEKMYVALLVICLIFIAAYYGDYKYGVMPLKTVGAGFVGWGLGNCIGTILLGLYELIKKMINEPLNNSEE